MDRSSRGFLPRVILAVLIVLVLAAAAVLVWLLASPKSASQVSERFAPVATAEPLPTQAPTAVPTPTATPEPTAEPTATPEPTAVPVMLGETPDAGQEYIDKIVFLGDSTTFGLSAYGLVPATQVWTDSIGTMSLFNWELDPIAYYDPASPYTAESLMIPDCAARRQPEYLIITLGINGIALLDEGQFRDYYVRMVQAIQEASPNTKIILQSVFPVIDRYVPNGISSEKVNAANVWIYDMAGQLGVRYLNTHDALMDETGQMRADYCDDTAMGIHMNTTGLNALLDFIRTHAYQ